jgi:hypothetical protein
VQRFQKVQRATAFALFYSGGFLLHILSAALQGDGACARFTGFAGAGFCYLQLQAAGFAVKDIPFFHFVAIGHAGLLS